MTKKELEIENRKLKFELEWIRKCVRGDCSRILRTIDQDHSTTTVVQVPPHKDCSKCAYYHDCIESEAFGFHGCSRYRESD